MCLSFVSQSGSGWSHDFPHLSPICFRLVSYSGSVGRVISLTCLAFVFHVFPTCLPLWVALGLVGRMISLTCLPCVFHLSPSLGPVGRMISLTCLPFVSDLSPILGQLVASFPSLVSHLFFHVFPTCLPLWVALGLVGRMISLTIYHYLFGVNAGIIYFSVNFIIFPYIFSFFLKHLNLSHFHTISSLFHIFSI